MADKLEPANKQVRRRRLLRGGATVLAGAVGAGVVTTVSASPAQADAGSGLILGTDNTAGTATTSVTTSSTSGATLSLANTALSSGEAGAPLQLVPSGDIITGPVGSVGMSADGTLYAVTADAFVEMVRTDWNTPQTVAITPTRLLDTRSSSGRTNLINPGALNSSGQVPAGGTIHLDLSSIMVLADAIFFNITVVPGSAAGFATVFPYATTKPGTSSINFQPSAAVANFGFVAVGWDATYSDAISIYVNKATHVLIDVTGISTTYPAGIAGFGAGLKAGQTSVARPTRVRPRG